MASIIPKKKLIKVPDSLSPAAKDEESFAGSASAQMGEDTLDEEHEVGLYPNADEDDPQELNIAGEIEKAEKAHRDG